MAATANASSIPTPNPNRIPSGTDCTLLAKYPAHNPATSPLRVEPITIPNRNGRAAGVNHAVRPSKMPRNAPSNNPSTGLFIFLPPGFYYDSTRFSLTAHKEKQPNPHNQIRHNQRRESPVPQHNANQPLQPALAMRADGEVIEESRDVGGQLGDSLVTARRIGFGSAISNRS